MIRGHWGGRSHIKMLRECFIVVNNIKKGTKERIALCVPVAESETDISGRSRERYHIADIRKTRDKLDEALKAKPKACMGC